MSAGLGERLAARYDQAVAEGLQFLIFSAASREAVESAIVGEFYKTMYMRGQVGHEQGTWWRGLSHGRETGSTLVNKGVSSWTVRATARRFAQGNEDNILEIRIKRRYIYTTHEVDDALMDFGEYEWMLMAPKEISRTARGEGRGLVLQKQYVMGNDFEAFLRLRKSLGRDPTPAEVEAKVERDARDALASIGKA